jgi:hypothetical protein
MFYRLLSQGLPFYDELEFQLPITDVLNILAYVEEAGEKDVHYLLS